MVHVCTCSHCKSVSTFYLIQTLFVFSLHSEIFQGLNIESEMEKINRPRHQQARKQMGWDYEQEELSFELPPCVVSVCLCLPIFTFCTSTLVCVIISNVIHSLSLQHYPSTNS